MRRVMLAISLFATLLSFGFGVLWARSHFAADYLTRGTAVGDWSLTSYRGTLGFETSCWYGDDPPPAVLTFKTSKGNSLVQMFPPRRLFDRELTTEEPFLHHAPAVRSTIHFLAISWSYYPVPPGGGYTYHPFVLNVPYAYLVTLSGLLSIPFGSWVVRTLRYHQVYTLCSTCGYDLRAHTPGEKCPECGKPVPLISGFLLSSRQ
jgi:hypothetical protein